MEGLPVAKLPEGAGWTWEIKSDKPAVPQFLTAQ